MGTVIAFPTDRLPPPAGAAGEAPGTAGVVVLLPVIRIERFEETPAATPPRRTRGAGRKPRRPSSRT